MSLTAAQVLAQGVAALRAAGVEDAATDARRLLAHVLGVAPGRLVMVLPDPVTEAQAAACAKAIAQRAAGRPVARITGTRAFWGRDFAVTEAVLDPRPDTESLVAAALAEPFSRVLDLGTGSGCILVTLLAERPGATGLGVDLSPAALSVAAANAARHGVAERAALAVSDWYAAVGGPFDLIVSNPPYIAAAEMAGLAPEVRDHDPQMALTDGADGLTAIRAVAAGARAHLVPGGRLLIEIGWRQGPAAAAILRQAGLADIRILPDIDGRDRIAAARA